jgi:hypothetical protein
VRAVAAAGLLLAGSSCGSLGYLSVQPSILEAADENETTTLLNWSGTHAVNVRNDSYWEPETAEELEAIVKHCHERHKPVRPLGSALSPNGIGFHPGGMVSLTNLDKIIEVDKDAMTVTVQAGARVSQVRTTDRTGRVVAWLAISSTNLGGGRSSSPWSHASELGEHCRAADGRFYPGGGSWNGCTDCSC